MLSIILIIVIAVMTLSLFMRWRSPTLDFSDGASQAGVAAYLLCIVVLAYMHLSA